MSYKLFVVVGWGPGGWGWGGCNFCLYENLKSCDRDEYRKLCSTVFSLTSDPVSLHQLLPRDLLIRLKEGFLIFTMVFLKLEEGLR